MAVKVLDFDLAAAVAQCVGQEFGEAACTVLAACSLANAELLLPASIDHGSAAVPCNSGRSWTPRCRRLRLGWSARSLAEGVGGMRSDRGGCRALVGEEARGAGGVGA